MGGAERYAYELAKAMAENNPVVFMSFAHKSSSHRDGALMVEHIPWGILGRGRCANPFSVRFLKWILWTDVIHCHQTHIMSTDLSLLIGLAFRKKVFVTDLGGCGRYFLSRYLPIMRSAVGFLLISEFSEKRWVEGPWKDRPRQSWVIGGGVNLDLFRTKPSKKKLGVLFVGRIRSEKGLDILLEAMPASSPLTIAGSIEDENYLRRLRSIALKKNVIFNIGCKDEELCSLYANSLVTVLPSLPGTELLGLTLLESMARGTPVICTNVGGMPEVVQEGITGFVVAPNDASALKEKIEWFLTHTEIALEMGKRAREEALKYFTWDKVVDRCLKAYDTDREGLSS